MEMGITRCKKRYMTVYIGMKIIPIVRYQKWHFINIPSTCGITGLEYGCYSVLDTIHSTQVTCTTYMYSMECAFSFVIGLHILENSVWVLKRIRSL